MGPDTIPKAFTGVGVYLATDVHSVRATRGYLAPHQLVNVLAKVVDFQQRIVEANGGLVEQFVGGAMIAYWLPQDISVALTLACSAAKRIVCERIPMPEVDYRLSVQFCAAEMAGAFFGPESARRFQVVGRARARAEALPKSVPGRDCVFTDKNTVAAMLPEDRSAFTPLDEKVWLMRIAS